jgi:hypothetical protein
MICHHQGDRTVDMDKQKRLKWVLKVVCEDAYNHLQHLEEKRPGPAYAKFEEYDDFYLCLWGSPEPNANKTIIPKEYLTFSDTVLEREIRFKNMASIPYPTNIEKAQLLFNEYLARIHFDTIWSYELYIKPEYKWAYVRTDFNNVACVPVPKETIMDSMTMCASKAATGFISYLLGKEERV